MFSGKSSEMMRQLRRRMHAKQRCIVFKYSKDWRNGSTGETLATHDRLSMPAVPYTSREDILEHVKSLDFKVDAIGIDEVQFCEGGARLVEQLVFEYDMDVIAAGLWMRFDGSFWEESLALTCIASTHTQMKAVCKDCGSEHAIHSYRTTADLQDMVIGGAEAYQALCAACFRTRRPDYIRTATGAMKQ